MYASQRLTHVTGPCYQSYQLWMTMYDIESLCQPKAPADYHHSHVCQQLWICTKLKTCVSQRLMQTEHASWSAHAHVTMPHHHCCQQFMIMYDSHDVCQPKASAN